MTTALLRSCHPLPAAAVTLFVTAVAVAVGHDASSTLLITAMVATGQLSIGWLNDAVDAERDRAAGRMDKPVALLVVPARTALRAALIAGTVCVPLSLAAGWVPGLAHLTGVAAGWAYDLGVKGTVWSPVPYALAFGLLPVLVWRSLPQGPAPPWWAVAAAALLGVGAHGANTLPDLEADRASGVLGLPQRLGPTRARVGTVVALVTATVLLVFAPPGPVGLRGWLALVAVAALVPLAAGPTSGRRPFTAAIGVAAICVALFVARAGGAA